MWQPCRWNSVDVASTPYTRGPTAGITSHESGQRLHLRLSSRAIRWGQKLRPVVRRRDSLVIAAWVSTLSWPARPAGIRSGSLPGLTRSALTVPCGTLCGWESSRSWRSTFSEVVRPQGRHTATFAWPSRDLRRTQLRSSARSSAGQSSCLLSRRAGVRIPPGALNCRFTSENAGNRRFLRMWPPLGSCSPARRPHPPRSRWFACTDLGAESLALIATALREQITGDRRAHEPRRRCLNLKK